MSSIREAPTEKHWELARALVTAFNDTDCRCDRIALTEGAKENLKIKVAHALQQREREARAEERELFHAAIIAYCESPQARLRTPQETADGVIKMIRRDSSQEGER